MTKTIYIHIGTEKTGTKSIQNFCCTNNDFLKENNLYYPFNRDKNYMHNITHWPLAAALAKNNQFVPEEKLLPAKELYETFIQDIEKVPYDNILISAEPFSVNVTEKKSIINLKNYLSGYNVKIIVYLRRQDNYFVSLTSTKVKGGVYYPNNMFSIDEALIDKERYDYNKLIGKWSEVFGKENIIVKPYERRSFKNENIIDDFFEIFGIDVSMLSAIKSEQNVSLSLDSLYFMNIINGKFNLDATERTKLFSLLEKRKSEFRIKNLISPMDRKEIIDYYESSNAKVAKNYLNNKDGILFNEPMPDVETQWNEFKGLMPETAFSICTYLLGYRYGLDADEKTINFLTEIVVKQFVKNQDSIFYNFKNETIEKGNMISWFKKKDTNWHLMSVGNDPYFLIPNFKNQAKNLSVQLEITVPEETRFQLFFRNINSGFNESNSITKHLRKGYNELRFELQSEMPISTIRVDPGTVEGEYIIHKLEIEGK